MIIKGQPRICPKCGGKLKYYDSTKRIIRTKYRKTETIIIPRFRCIECGSTHRELPENMVPYKQYERDMIDGVLDGYITSEVLGFEDYPCERTMERWKSENGQSITIIIKL